MRKWRAIAAVSRVLFADAVLGLYTLDELDAPTQVMGGELVLADNRGPQAQAQDAEVVDDAQPEEAAAEPVVRAPKPVDPTPAKNPKVGRPRKAVTDPVAETETASPTQSQALRAKIASLYKMTYPDTKATIITDVERANANQKLAENRSAAYWTKVIRTLEMMIQDKLANYQAQAHGQEPDAEYVPEEDDDFQDEAGDEGDDYEGDED
jgi:hypothetical protein